jgi:hypothetical protein
VGGDTGLALSLTGPFNTLDAELTLHIFASLDFLERLRVVSEVCKGWRSLRRHPALWASLSLSAPAFTTAGVLAFLSGPRSPLPSPGCCAALELGGGRGKKGLKASALKAALKALSAATDVTLSGSHLSKEAFAALAKPRAAPLRALKLGQVGSALDATTAVLDVLAPALTQLEFDGLVTDAWLAAADARAAASGAPLPLTCLEVGERGECMRTGMHVAAFCRLGATFPRLATLRIAGARGMDGLDAKHAGGAAPAAPCSSLRAWALLPALRSLHVASMCFAMHVRGLPAAEVADFVRRVTAAAPGLRVLHLSRGTEMPSDIHNLSAHAYAPLPPLPGPDLCGIGALQHLEVLELAYLGVSAEAAAGASFPSLKRLQLDHCGPHAAAAAATIAACAPRLHALAVLNLTRTGLGGETGPGADGLATLASASLRELRLESTTHVSFLWQDGIAVAETNAGFGAALRGLAARRALPALRSLLVDCDAGRLPADTFDAEHPWAALQALALPRLAADAVAAVLAPLRAPRLTQLSVAGIARGVVQAQYARRDPTAAAVKSYEAMRADKRAPLLPPLRFEEAGAQPPAPAPAGGAGAAGAGSSDSDE